MRAQPRRSELPRSRRKRPYPRPGLRWSRSGFAAVSGRERHLRPIPAALHSLQSGLRFLRRNCERAMIRTPWQLAVVGLALSALMLAACSSGTAAPPVAHLAGSADSAASPNDALHLAGQCLRAHGLPSVPDPVVATDGPAAGQGILNKSAMKTYPDAVVLQATTACDAALA